MLTSLGYDVTTQPDGIEALKTFQENPHRFDLIITDFTMPHMTGYALAAEMMRIRPGIPVILCTGYNEAASREKARRAGIAEAIRTALDDRMQ